MYEKVAARMMSNIKKAIPIFVIRRGKLNIPVPNAPAINAKTAAGKGVFIGSLFVDYCPMSEPLIPKPS
jgi:hypothetical protein